MGWELPIGDFNVDFYFDLCKPSITAIAPKKHDNAAIFREVPEQSRMLKPVDNTSNDRRLSSADNLWPLIKMSLLKPPTALSRLLRLIDFV